MPLIVLQYRELLEQSGLNSMVQGLADETDVSRSTQIPYSLLILYRLRFRACPVPKPKPSRRQ